MPTYNPNDFYPRTGQEIKSDGTTANEADGLNADGSRNVVVVNQNNKPIPKNGTTQRLFYQTGIVIAPGASSTVNVDVSLAERVAVGLVADANSANTLYCYWTDKATTTVFNYVTLLSNASRPYGMSSKLDALTDRLVVGITNNDTVSHTYTIGVWGS